MDEEYGIMRDERKAMEFYQKAAALNNPEALYLLYLMGKLEIPSREEAERHPDAYARYPRLAEIDNELRRTMAELMAAALQRGEDP